MKLFKSKYQLVVVLVIILSFSFTLNEQPNFQGKAIYVSKSKMNLGKWGKRLSELEKKQIKERLKNRLEKTYTLTFSMNESIYEENETIDAVSGATDSWGKNFSPGKQYKNTKTNTQIQQQEFYGKNFLVKDSLTKINWVLGSETKKIGNYECYKATAEIPNNDLTWYSFSWSKLRNKQANKDGKKAVNMVKIEAWYTPQIPVNNGPHEFWGLPGLILEASYGNTILLCTEISLTNKNSYDLNPPEKGEVVAKNEYKTIIFDKMKEFRQIRGGRRRR